VVFDLRWMIGNQINSFAASLLCEKKEYQDGTIQRDGLR